MDIQIPIQPAQHSMKIYYIQNITNHYVTNEEFIQQIVFNSKNNLSPKQFETFVGSRDGHKYNITKIEDQTWMAENLAYLPAVSSSSQGSDYTPY